MRAEVVLYAFIFFTLTMILHIVIWRIHHPKPSWPALVVILFATPLVALIMMWGLVSTGTWSSPLRMLTLVEWLATYMLHCALGMSYIFIYPTAEFGSPSLRMVLLLKASMPQGLSTQEIERLDRQDDLGPRIDDLIQMGLVVETEYQLTLTLAGQLFTRPFLLLRRLLGLPPSEG